MSIQDFFTLLIAGISQGCTYGLIALGFVLVYKATEIVNFSHGEFMMLGAFFALMFSAYVGFWTGIILAVCVLGLLGYLLDSVIMRRIGGENPALIFIITVAFGFIFRSAAGMIWGWEPLAFPGYFNGTSQFGPIIVQHSRLAIIVLSIILFILLFVFFSYNRLGIAMQAISQNQLAAYYMSIPVKQTTSLVWVLGAAIAAIAGIFNAPFTQVDTHIGFIGIKALAGAIIGGFGSIPGAIIGCLIIGILEPFSDLFLPAVKGISGYLAMFIILMIRPDGLIRQTFVKKV